MGFTLNMLTMLALTLSVGIVIDDAIVVLENIYRFIEEKGMPPMEAAVAATKEIGLAVLATTLSLVAIFAPVGFMSGIVGRFMQSFGLTMAFAVLVSLFVSFTLTPMMSAYWLKAPEKGVNHRDSKHNRLFDPLDRAYTRMLHWAMSHRGLVAMGAVLVLLSSVPLFRVTAVNFTPEDDQSQFDVLMRAPEGTSLAATEVLANRLGNAIRKIPEVEFTLVTVAGDAAGTLNSASMLVRLHPIEASFARSVRGDVAGPGSHSAGVREGRPSSRGAGRRRPRRWRRRHSVHGAGARTGPPRDLQQRAEGEGDRHPRPRGRGHLAQCRQARDVGQPRSAEGSRPRRPDCRRGRSPATDGRGRSGDDVQ